MKQPTGDVWKKHCKAMLTHHKIQERKIETVMANLDSVSEGDLVTFYEGELANTRSTIGALQFLKEAVMKELR